MSLKTWPLLALVASGTAGRLGSSPGLPIVINTWSGSFQAATDAAFLALKTSPSRTSALDAVELGCSTCERSQCDGSVGFGGSPDENCETTLDAMIMDGTTMDAGSVGSLRRVRDAISVARHVMRYTTHTMLAGDLATKFAVENGFAEDVGGSLSTNESLASCEAWKAAGCQPNYRRNVTPDPKSSCGPYSPVSDGTALEQPSQQASHDTISMIVVHPDGSMAAGTTTNGASHKVPGRVGDGPIVGSGSYVDGDVGGCGATGDGDIMMRYLPCYQAVENLRLGMTPTDAAEDVVARMAKRHPGMASGIIVMDRKGNHAGAGFGWTFTYSVRGGSMNETEVVVVAPIKV